MRCWRKFCFLAFELGRFPARRVISKRLRRLTSAGAYATVLAWWPLPSNLRCKNLASRTSASSRKTAASSTLTIIRTAPAKLRLSALRMPAWHPWLENTWEALLHCAARMAAGIRDSVNWRARREAERCRASAFANHCRAANSWLSPKDRRRRDLYSRHCKNSPSFLLPVRSGIFRDARTPHFFPRPHRMDGAPNASLARLGAFSLVPGLGLSFSLGLLENRFKMFFISGWAMGCRCYGRSAAYFARGGHRSVHF